MQLKNFKNYTDEQTEQLLQLIADKEDDFDEDDGRLLDIQVCIKVLNYKLYGEEIIGRSAEPILVFYNVRSRRIDYTIGSVQIYRNGDNSFDGVAKPLPFYSSSESYKFVIDAMIERGNNVRIEYSQNLALWRVSFNVLFHGSTELSEAVCLAALAESKNQD